MNRNETDIFTKGRNWSKDLVVKLTISKMVAYTAATKFSDFIRLFMGKNIINVRNVEELTTKQMKYFLFISFHSGLRHNALYESLTAVRESLEQLVEEENLDLNFEEISSVEELNKHFEFHDDYYGGLSNGDWFHIQEVSEEVILRMAGPISPLIVK